MVLRGRWVGGVPGQSTEVGRVLRTGYRRGQDDRAGSRQSSLPEGSVTTRHGSSPHAGSARGHRARPPGPRRRPRRHPARGGCRGAAGSWCRPPWAAARGTARAAPRGRDGCRSAAGIALATGCHPDSSAQNAASRAGSALSSGSAAIGPDGAYSGRSSMTQNGLPSGSASTTHGTSRWPMSRCRAPSSRARRTTSSCRGPPRRSRCSRGLGGDRLGHRLEAQVEHEPVGHGEPRLEQVGLVGERAAPEQRLPEGGPAPAGRARR